jgi:Clp amino terminal domain, pathogenicity island component/UvrB/uvrC motif
MYLVATVLRQTKLREAVRSMFERFTDRARRVVVLAQEEARMLGHDYIGTEHILLGLLADGSGIPNQAMASLGITGDAVRQQVEEVVGRGHEQPTEHIPFTSQAKTAFQLSLREAMRQGQNFVGTEHILLGLIGEADGPAAQLLVRLGAGPDRVRQQVVALLSGDAGGPVPQQAGPAQQAGRSAQERRPVPQTERPARLPGKAGRARRERSALLTRFESVESRLSALERRVGAGPDVHDLDQEITQLRRGKEAAIDAEDFESAALLRDREAQVVSKKAAWRQEWAAAQLDLPSLSEEVEDLRGLLRDHGIEPQGGAA